MQQATQERVEGKTMLDCNREWPVQVPTTQVVRRGALGVAAALASVSKDRSPTRRAGSETKRKKGAEVRAAAHSHPGSFI
eukprot:1160727-Pelagomonas_calceolata.AAC.11